jgi:hypothetical protein
MRWRVVLFGVPAGLLLLSACANGAGKGVSAPAVGYVQGVDQMEGGAMPPGGGQPPVRPVAGAVLTFRDASGQVRVRTGAAGRFRAQLATGSWTVSPAASPATVIVRPGQTTRVTVMTYVP